MAGTFNTSHSIGTDVAAWFLFHPDDLAHRRDDPIDWWAHDFAVGKEFVAGTLVAVETGSDGVYIIRCTDGALTEREKRYRVAASHFRLRVRHGTLHLDAGNTLPSAEMLDTPVDDPNRWIGVANGDYRVTVHAIAWREDPDALDVHGAVTDAALPDYVTVFEPVADLNAVAPLPSLPRLEPWRPADNVVSARAAAPSPLERTTHWLKELFGRESSRVGSREYLVFLRTATVFPHVGPTTMPLSEPEAAALKQSDGGVILTASLTAGTVATEFGVMSYGSALTQDVADPGYDMTGTGVRRVRLRAVREHDGMYYARTEAYNPPPTQVADAATNQLRVLFARYAANDRGYQQRIPHHRFYAERVAALTDARIVGWSVANALDLSPMERYALLIATDTAMITQLIALLMS